MTLMWLLTLMTAATPAGAAGSACAETAPGRPDIIWNARVCDLGAFHEEEGVRTGYLTMFNAGDVPVHVGSVRVSCGCTSAGIPVSELAPGDSAVLTLSYDPAGRPGAFDRTVRVRYEGYETADTLRIKGLVMPDEATLDNAFPVKAGPLRLSASVIDGGEIERGRTRHFFIQMYNDSERPVTPALTTDDPRVRVSADPDTLGAGETGTAVIQVTVTPTGSDATPSGPNRFVCRLEPDGNTPPSEIIIGMDVIPARPINHNEPKP